MKLCCLTICGESQTVQISDPRTWTKPKPGSTTKITDPPAPSPEKDDNYPSPRISPIVSPPVTRPPEPKPKAPSPPEQSSKQNETDQNATERRGGIYYAPQAADPNQEIKTFNKSVEARAQIKSALTGNVFLKSILVDKRLDIVIDAMYPKTYKKNDYIINQGEIGEHMYVSASGEYQVFKDNAKQGKFGGAIAFGELAIMYNEKRAATIKALTKADVWVLDRAVYQVIIAQDNNDEDQKKVDFLQKVNILNTLSYTNLMNVASLLESRFYKAGDAIVKQGENGDEFFIIKAGKVEVVIKDDSGNISTKLQLRTGEYFGELALFDLVPRKATVTASPPGVECLYLKRENFLHFFGGAKDAISGKWVVSAKSQTETIRVELTDVDFKDIKEIRTIGVGGFGRVKVVECKNKKGYYAMKSLKRIDMIQQEQVEHVTNERDNQIACNSPFIVRMYRTYMDSRYLYFLMEFCEGGDLWSRLQKEKRKRFEEKEAKFVTGCVLEALLYLHEKRIIYRDLKPENLLISNKGYVKLTDFGFAKKLKSPKTYTFAGTPEYVAPEIILNRGHDRAIDIWALGIFIYELLAGYTPFRSSDGSHMKTYNLILKGIDTINFSQSIGDAPKKLIKKLCRSIATERLGYQSKSEKEKRGEAIKRDPWFKGFSWEALQQQEMKGLVMSSKDPKKPFENFDKCQPDLDIPPEDTSHDFDNFDSLIIEITY